MQVFPPRAPLAAQLAVVRVDVLVLALDVRLQIALHGEGLAALRAGEAAAGVRRQLQV